MDDLQELREFAQAAPIRHDIGKVLLRADRQRIRCLEQRWVSFEIDVLQQRGPSEPFTWKPPFRHMQTFIKYLFIRFKGAIETRLTEKTLANRWNTIRRVIMFYTNEDYTIGEKKVMEQFIKHIGASRRERPKPIACANVTKDLLEYVWFYDEYDYPHHREPVQTSALIALFSSSGLRIGEILESSAHKRSNEGLCYNDLRFTAMRDKRDRGKLIFKLQIAVRYRKNHRNEKGPGFMMFESNTHRSHCLVTYFLALALADEALVGVCQASDLSKITIEPERICKTISIRKDKAHKPVFRAILNGKVSEDRILTAQMFTATLRSLGQRAGYKDDLTSYCFRRAVGNKLDENATPAQRRQIMGHASDETYQSYISRQVGVDIQAVMLGTPQRKQEIGEAQSMLSDRDLRAPRPFGSELTIPFRAPLEQSKAEVWSTLSPPDRSQAKLRHDQELFKRTRSEFWETIDERDIINDLTSTEETTHMVEAASRKQPPFLQIVLRYDKERSLVASNFMAKSDSLTLADAVAPLKRMANPVAILRYYPEAEPDNQGRCADCGSSLVDYHAYRDPRFNQHLLRCARRRIAKQAGEKFASHVKRELRQCCWGSCSQSLERFNAVTIAQHMTDHVGRLRVHRCLWKRCGSLFANDAELSAHLDVVHHVPCISTARNAALFCHECSLWIHSKMLWEMHCNDHLSRLTRFCGIIRRFGLVVVAAHCPFCVGAAKREPSTRWHQFDDVHKLHKHIRQHLIPLSGALRCPHPLCPGEAASPDQLFFHFQTNHGMPPPQPLKGRGKIWADGYTEHGLSSLDEPSSDDGKMLSTAMEV